MLRKRQVLHVRHRDVILWLAFLALCQAQTLTQNDATNVRNCSGNRVDENCGQEKQNSTQRRKIIVTTILMPPYMILKDTSTGSTGNDRFEGYIADILRQISHSLGFEYEIRLLSLSEKSAALLPNGNWDGLVDELLTGAADIAAAPFHAKHPWKDVVDFTEPIISTRLSAILSRPRSMNNESNKDLQRHSRELATFDQLFQSNLTYGIVAGDLAHTIMSVSNDTVKEVWNKIEQFRPSAYVKNVDEGIGRVRSGQYALILETVMAEYLSNRQPCDLYCTEPFAGIGNFVLGVSRSINGSSLIRAKRYKEMDENNQRSSNYSPYFSKFHSPGKEINDSTNSRLLPTRNMPKQSRGISNMSPGMSNVERSTDPEERNSMNSDYESDNPELNLRLTDTSIDLKDSIEESESENSINYKIVRVKRSRKADRRYKQRMEERRDRERAEEERNDKTGDDDDDDDDNDDDGDGVNKKKAKKGREEGGRERDREDDGDKKEKEKEEEEEEDEEDDEDEDKEEGNTEKEKKKITSFLEEFNKELRRMKKSGELVKIFSRWWKYECNIGATSGQSGGPHREMVPFVQNGNGSGSRTVISSNPVAFLIVVVVGLLLV